MSKANSTPAPTAGKTQKPNKPDPDFPLFAHAAGVWAKKIRGKMYYFGKWDEPDSALAKYDAEKDALHAGRKPREDTDGLTVKETGNRFLHTKQTGADSGELTETTVAGTRRG